MTASNSSNRNVKKAEGTLINLLSGWFSRPDAILFGFAVFYFLLQLLLVVRLNQQNAFAVAAGLNPIVVITQPLLLLVGAICLLIDRRWSYLVALMLAISLIYSNVYLVLIGISHTHGVQPFGRVAFRLLLEIMSGTQFVNTGVAIVILIFSLARHSRWIPRRMRDVTIGTGAH